MVPSGLIIQGTLYFPAHFRSIIEWAMARDAMAETGASKEDIDDLFGWLQAQRAKDQQKAYAGIAERSVRARCTMMI